MMWRCANYNKDKCKSRLVTNGNTLRINYSAHNHIANYSVEKYGPDTWLQSELINVHRADKPVLPHEFIIIPSI